MYVFCLGSLARHWLARKPECIYVCMCSVLGHWRGIGLLVKSNVYMYVCVTSVKKKRIFPTRSSGIVPTKGSLVPLNKEVLSDKK